MGRKSPDRLRKRERAALEHQERIAFARARGPLNRIKRRLFRQAGPASAPAPARIRLGHQVISFGPHAGTRWSQLPTEYLEKLLRDGTNAEFVLNLATEALLRRARREQLQSIQPKRTTGSRPAITAGSGPQGRRYRDPGVGPSDTGHPANQITCQTTGSSPRSAEENGRPPTRPSGPPRRTPQQGERDTRTAEPTRNASRKTCGQTLPHAAEPNPLDVLQRSAGSSPRGQNGESALLVTQATRP